MKKSKIFSAFLAVSSLGFIVPTTLVACGSSTSTTITGNKYIKDEYIKSGSFSFLSVGMRGNNDLSENITNIFNNNQEELLINYKSLSKTQKDNLFLKAEVEGSIGNDSLINGNEPLETWAFKDEILPININIYDMNSKEGILLTNNFNLSQFINSNIKDIIKNSLEISINETTQTLSVAKSVRMSLSSISKTIGVNKDIVHIPLELNDSINTKNNKKFILSFPLDKISLLLDVNTNIKTININKNEKVKFLYKFSSKVIKKEINSNLMREITISGTNYDWKNPNMKFEDTLVKYVSNYDILSKLGWLKDDILKDSFAQNNDTVDANFLKEDIKNKFNISSDEKLVSIKISMDSRSPLSYDIYGNYYFNGLYNIDLNVVYIGENNDDYKKGDMITYSLTNNNNKNFQLYVDNAYVLNSLISPNNTGSKYIEIPSSKFGERFKLGSLATEKNTDKIFNEVNSIELNLSKSYTMSAFTKQFYVMNNKNNYHIFNGVKFSLKAVIDNTTSKYYSVLFNVELLPGFKFKEKFIFVDKEKNKSYNFNDQATTLRIFGFTIDRTNPATYLFTRISDRNSNDMNMYYKNWNPKI